MGNQNTHFMFNIFLFFKFFRLWDKVEKYCRAGQTPDGMEHAHCVLDNQGYKYTRILFNTYYFSTTTTVAETSLNITLCIHCLSC